MCQRVLGVVGGPAQVISLAQAQACIGFTSADVSTPCSKSHARVRESEGFRIFHSYCCSIWPQQDRNTCSRAATPGISTCMHVCVFICVRVGACLSSDTQCNNMNPCIFNEVTVARALPMSGPGVLSDQWVIFPPRSVKVQPIRSAAPQKKRRWQGSIHQ